MADKYCVNCDRMVAPKKSTGAGVLMILIGIALAMFIPILGWIIGFFLVLGGIVMIICSGKKCPICGSKKLLASKPATATTTTAETSATAPATAATTDKTTTA